MVKLRSVEASFIRLSKPEIKLGFPSRVDGAIFDRVDSGINDGFTTVFLDLDILQSTGGDSPTERLRQRNQKHRAKS